MVSSFISQFALPSLVAPLVPLPPSLVPPPATAPAATARPGGGGTANQAAARGTAQDGGLISGDLGPISQQLLQPKLLALLLLAHCLTVLSHPPLLNALATLLLHPRLDLATVAFSADGTHVSLPLADAGPARNALRAELLGCLAHPDERLVLLSSCLLLAALRAKGIHSELLRQASLLPVRQVRSQSLLERLIAKSGQTSALFGRGAPPQPGPERSTSSLFGRSSPDPPSPGPFGTAAGSGGGEDGGGSPAPGLLAMQRSYGSGGSLHSYGEEEEYKEYCAEAVEPLLLLLTRTATGADGAADGAVGGAGGAGGAEIGHLLVRGVERLVTVQAVVELLLELLLDSSTGVVLDTEHVALLTNAHAAACATMRHAFKGAPN